MRTLKHANGKRLVDFILHRLRIKQQQTIDIELQQAIDACTSVGQLKDLLFASKNKTEAMLRAFDKRFEELEGV